MLPLQGCSTKSVRGENRCATDTIITQRGKETKIKRHIRPEDPTTENDAAQAFFSFFLGECHRPQRRTYTQSNDQCEQSLAFFLFPKGGGVVTGFRLLEEEGVHNKGDLCGPPRKLWGVADDVQCEGTTAATTVKHVEREREREK